MQRDFTVLGSIGPASREVYTTLLEFGELGATTNQIRDKLNLSYNTVRNAIKTMEKREWVAPIFSDRFKNRDTKYRVTDITATTMPQMLNPNPNAQLRYVNVDSFWSLVKWMIEHNEEQKWMKNPHYKLIFSVAYLFRAAANAQFAVESKIPESQRELFGRFLNDQRMSHELLIECLTEVRAIEASILSAIDNPKFWTESPKQLADLLINDPERQAEDNHELVVQEFNVIQEFLENFKPAFQMDRPKFNIQYKQTDPPVGSFEVGSAEDRGEDNSEDDLFTIA
jgi:DNA-binding MarR family transcriptional regulator